MQTRTKNRRRPGAGGDDCQQRDSRPTSAGAASYQDNPTPSMEGRSRGSALVVGREVNERRFVIVGQTVRVLIDYDGLKGCYGTVVGGDHSDGKVLVLIRDRRVCFLSRELVVIPDLMADEVDCAVECRLVSRAARLKVMAKYDAPSDSLRAAILRRYDRLVVQIRAIQRAKGHWNSTALVVWNGRAA